MSLQLTLQRRGAPCQVAIIEETPFSGAEMNLFLIVAPGGPDSIWESIILRQNCTYLSSLTLNWLIRCIGAFVVTGFEVRGPFSVLPASWQPVFKATTPKCASWGVLGNTTALCAACLWIIVAIAESGTCICIMFVRTSSLMRTTYVFYDSGSLVWWASPHPDCCMRSDGLQRRLWMRNLIDVM